MSFRVVPSAQPSGSVSGQATAHPITGTHDAMRHGLTPASQAAASSNMSPLQARLEKWSHTQKELQQTMACNTFGLGVPLRQEMELKLVSDSPHHPLLHTTSASSLPLGGSHNLALEILRGEDETLDAADFMAGSRDMGEVLDTSAIMEKSRGM